MERQPTCAERIEGELAGRLAELREFHERIFEGDDDDDREQADEELNCYPLCADARIDVRVQISTGGPGDEFLFTLDEDGGLLEVRYRFLDWWDGATRTLGQDDAVMVYEVLQRFVDYAAHVNDYAR